MPINCPKRTKCTSWFIGCHKNASWVCFCSADNDFGLNYSLHDSFVLESELNLNKIFREIREFSFMILKSWVLDSRTNVYLNERLRFGPFFVPDSTWWYDWFGKEFYIGRNLTWNFVKFQFLDLVSEPCSMVHGPFRENFGLISLDI